MAILLILEYPLITIEHKESYDLKALFLDRDGVINYDYGYVHCESNFHFVEGIFDLCRHFIKLGYIIIVITNQSGIAKKLYSEKDFLSLNQWMIERFKDQGIEITKTYYCPHDSIDGCNCRKPKPGMIFNAINEFALNPKECVLIGDNSSDLEAGKLARVGNLVLFDKIDHYDLINSLEKMIK